MRSGKTLTELAVEIDRQQKNKRDFVAPSAALKVLPTGDQLELATGQAPEVLGIGETFHRQMASRLSIPKVYYDRMRSEAPELLAENANHWLQAQPARRMVRTLDGTARALLSDRYRPLDHSDLLEAILPALRQVGGIVVKSCEVTERRLYVQAVTERLSGEIRVGDTVQAGIVISNSEIGEGSLRIEHLLYRLVCLNGMVTGDALRKTHVGRSKSNGFDVEGAREFFTDRTRQLDDAAFFSKVKDTVSHVLNPQTFEETLDVMRGAARRVIEGDPAKVVENVAKRLELGEGERGGVLRHLIEGGDLSAWGLANAVTRLAHDSEDYDRSVELERAGAAVIELPKSDWQSLAV